MSPTDTTKTSPLSLQQAAQRVEPISYQLESLIEGSALHSYPEDSEAWFCYFPDLPSLTWKPWDLISIQHLELSNTNTMV